MTTTRNCARHTSVPLRAREAALLASMLAGATVSEAAKATGMSRSAAYRASKRESFQNALQASRSELLTSTIDRLRTKARDAANTLAEVSADANPPKTAQARVSAARETLGMMFRGVEIFEIDNRLRRLEGIAAQEPQK